MCPALGKSPQTPVPRDFQQKGLSEEKGPGVFFERRGVTSRRFGQPNCQYWTNGIEVSGVDSVWNSLARELGDR